MSTPISPLDQLEQMQGQAAQPAAPASTVSPLDQLEQQVNPPAKQFRDVGTNVNPQSSFTDRVLGALAPQSVPTSKGAGSTQDVGGFEGSYSSGDENKGAATSAAGTAALLGLLGANYGPGAVEAVKAAAASHPFVAKLLLHGLAATGEMKVAKMLHVFDGK